MSERPTEKDPAANLCRATSGRAVRIAPHAVFRSSGGRLLVTGPPVPLPGERPGRSGPRHFDLRNIESLEMTEEAFQPDLAFDATAHRFRYGIECSVASAGNPA